MFAGSGSQYSDLVGGVYRFSKNDGSLILKIGAAPGKFPFGIAFGPDGLLYVNDYNAKTIEHYNPNTGQLLGNFVQTFNLATSFVFGPDGNLYLASQYAIERFDGNTGASMGVFTSGRYIQAPYSFTFGPDGDLYVFDQRNYDVLRFNGVTGAFVSVFIDGQYLFNPTCGMAFGPDGNFYTTNFVVGNVPVNGGIDMYDGQTGKFLRHFVSPGQDFASAGIAFDYHRAIPEPNA